MTLPQELMQTISEPTIAYLLLTIGMTGLFLELANPGAIIPGVAGGVSILLALSSLQKLDPSWTGVLLMGFAFVLFLIDAYVPSHGALTLGGIASFAFGSFMLSNSVDRPASGISRFAIAGVTLLIAAFFLFAVGAVLRTRTKRSTTGQEGMRGLHGEVRSALTPDGFVFIAGELWHARTLGDDIPVGTMVRVIDVEGLTALVEPAESITSQIMGGESNLDGAMTPSDTAGVTRQGVAEH